ncbi:MAG TPA: hypothetical protein VF665_00670 [Longimicrobium sp.]|jgi:hypothetical protein|uniref:hypothetical protein n=1 Tax=Longimicrobium sp. TaxID=2029185 RepID=UPI002ED7F964
MSEYQYYEFRAVDRRLAPEQMRELRAVSTRARITPSSFVNSYEWGNFKGDRAAWMERYFDAFLYFANWGARQIMLRLPAGTLNDADAAPYAAGHSFSVRVADGALILDFAFADEEGGDWKEDGTGWMSSILPLRAELAAGDLRALYLGWLLCAQQGDLDDDEPEPPVPAGLAELSPALTALAGFLRLDDDLIRAAAEGSPPFPPVPDAAQVRAWVAALPDARRVDLLTRVAMHEAARVHTELARELAQARRSADGATSGTPRTVRELLDAADGIAAARHRTETERAARETAKRAAHAAEVRARHLDAVAARGESVWRQIEDLVDSKKPASYKQALELIADLRDLAARGDTTEDFDRQIAGLRIRHSKKTTFLQKLGEALEPQSAPGTTGRRTGLFLGTPGS